MCLAVISTLGQRLIGGMATHAILSHWLISAKL
jgi:hypothetical protein